MEKEMLKENDDRRMPGTISFFLRLSSNIVRPFFTALKEEVKNNESALTLTPPSLYSTLEDLKVILFLSL